MRFFRRSGPDVSSELQPVLARYLELRIQALEREQREYESRKRNEQARTELARTVTRLLLLAVYAAILGELSVPLLIGTLTDPAALARGGLQAERAVNAGIGVVPDSLRGTLLGGVSTFLVFLFGAASMRALSDLGGMVFVGVATLSILAFSAAATSGLIGSLAALPGLIASAYVIYAFMLMIHRLHADALDAAPGPSSEHPGPGSRVRAWLARLAGPAGAGTRWIWPGQSRWTTLAFVALPVVAVLAVAAVGMSTGVGSPGPLLYWVSWSGQRAAVLWCIWAFVVTPRSVRIPLWSGVAWTGLVLALVFISQVSAAFGLAMSAILIANVMVIVLGWSGAWHRLWRPGATAPVRHGGLL